MRGGASAEEIAALLAVLAARIPAVRADGPDAGSYRHWRQTRRNALRDIAAPERPR